MDPEAARLQRQARNFFLAAFVFLVLLSLTWSLGPAFVYIFLGAAAYFAFLGASRIMNAAVSQQSYYRGTAQPREATFADWWYKTINDIKIAFMPKAGQAYSGAADMRARMRKIVMIAFLIAGSFVFMIVIIGVLSGGGGDDVEYIVSGEMFYAKGKLDSAKYFYRKALDDEETQLTANIGMGKSMIDTQEYDSALYFYNKALALDPQNTEALGGKAAAYYNKSSYGEALSVLNQLLEITPDYGWGLLLTGDCYYMQKNYAQALPYYEKAYELGERSKELSHIMAFCYDTKQEYAKALTFYTEALTYGDDTDISRRVAELERGN